jgi:hypothetical protein
MTHAHNHDTDDAAAGDFHPLYFEYWEHWNAERFWEAHESLEELWRRTDDENRLFLQGLIQAAGAFHHVQRERWDPARVLFAQSLSYLVSYAPSGEWEGLVMAPMCAMLESWGERARRRFAGEEEGAPPPFPKLGPTPEYVVRFAPTQP